MPLHKKDAWLIAAIAIIGAIIFTIFYFLFYKPVALQIETVRNELATEQRLLDIIKDKKGNGSSETLENTEALQRRIPVKSMSDQFLLDIEDAKTISGVEIKEIHFSDSSIESMEVGDEVDNETEPEEAITGPERPKGMQKLTVDMKVETADYFAWEDFLTRMNGLERIVKIEGVSFSNPEEANLQVTFYMKVSAYYMPELTDLPDHLPQVDAPNPANKIHPFN